MMLRGIPSCQAPLPQGGRRTFAIFSFTLMLLAGTVLLAAAEQTCSDGKCRNQLAEEADWADEDDAAGEFLCVCMHAPGMSLVV